MGLIEKRLTSMSAIYGDATTPAAGHDNSFLDAEERGAQNHRQRG